MASFKRERGSLTRIDPLLSTTRTILMAAFSSCAALVVAVTTIPTARAKSVVERLPGPIGGRAFQACRLQLMALLLAARGAPARTRSGAPRAAVHSDRQDERDDHKPD